MKAHKLPEGFMWNPLLKLPRNSPCPCKSGKKFKKCHLPKMTRMLPLKAPIKEQTNETEGTPTDSGNA